MTEFDVVVVGAGIEGSAAAYHIAKRGLKVLLLEQYDLLHENGSSHGGSRITRRTYLEPHFADMMVESYKLWDEAEKESGIQCFEKTGGLLLFKKGSSAYDQVKANVDRHGVKHQILSAQQIKEKYGVTYDSEYFGLLEEDAGILRATDATNAFHKLLLKHGGVIQDGEQVQAVVPGPRVTVRTSQGVYRALKVVLCPGAWLQPILRPLGLEVDVTVMEVSVCYWRADPKRYDAQRFPIFMDYSSNPMVYGFPIFEAPGLVKILVHTGDETTVKARHGVANPHWVRMAGQYVQQHFPGVDGTRDAGTLTCLYTMTPTEDFILDRHPQHPNIIIGGGFSGHGFKLAPVVGSVLARLAAGEPISDVEMSHFKIARVLKPAAKL
eukprot:m.223779 g.223779  ORF g.223779 m.223779 type:complete len:381 (+) comp16324_c0_seq1:1101-2243(+)